MDPVDKKRNRSVHKLIHTTFSKFTKCDHCSRFLWGIVKQGLTCQKCGFVCHPGCVKEVELLNCKKIEINKEELKKILTPVSSPIMIKEEDSKQSLLIHQFVNGDPKINTSPAKTDLVIATAEMHDNSEDNLKYRSLDNIPTNNEGNSLGLIQDLDSRSLNSTINTSFRKSLSNRLRRYASDEFKLSTSSSTSDTKPYLDTIVQGVIQQADKNKKQLQIIRNPPKLSLLTTIPHNFTKFITRITPVRLLYEKILSILTWEYPYKTWVILIFYCLICYRPLWMLVLPHFLLWYYLANEYIGIYQQGNNSNKTSSTDKNKEEISSTTIYSQNMQFVQNLMGTYTEFYGFAIDSWETLYPKLNSSNVIVFSSLTFPITLFIVKYIPINLMFMIIGLLILLCNNPLILAIFVTISPLLVDEISNKLDKATKVLSAKGLVSPIFIKGTRLKTRQVFENQRWWAILGWKDQLITGERPLWSDYKGKIEYPAIYNISADPGYKWDEEEWKINKEWSHPIQIDKDGWIYYNNIWEAATNSARIDSFTRRRLWQRNMIPIKKSNVPTPAELVNSIAKEEN